MQPVILDNYFDKIFYINLQRDVKRNEFMLRQFELYGITNFERVEGTVLNELPEEKHLYRNFIKDQRQYILGQLGCRASHLSCIEIAKERDYKQILILEDDISMLVNPNELLQQNLNHMHDWDMLYFGGLIEPHYRGQIVCAHAYGVKQKIYDDIIYLGQASGMEVDNFYAKILQHMSYNYNPGGQYNILQIQPFNMIVQNKSFLSNIQN